MAAVTCSVGNDDVSTVLTTTKTLYVAGSSSYDICFQSSSICTYYRTTAKPYVYADVHRCVSVN